MRHRITSFRAVEPNLPPLVSDETGGVLPGSDLDLNVIHPGPKNKSCIDLFCCQNQAFALRRWISQPLRLANSPKPLNFKGF